MATESRQKTPVIQLYTSDVQFVDLILEGGIRHMSIAFIVDAAS